MFSQLSPLRSCLRSASLSLTTQKSTPNFNYSLFTSQSPTIIAISPSLTSNYVSSPIVAPHTLNSNPNFNYSLFISQSPTIISPISSLTSPYSTIANYVSSPIVAPHTLIPTPNFNYSLFTSQSPTIISPISSLISPYSTIASVSSPIVASNTLIPTPNSSFSPVASCCFASQSPTVSKLSHSRSALGSSLHVPLIRSYSVPGFRSGKVITPDLIEQIQEGNFKYNVEQRQISETNPDDPVIELAFFQAPALDVSLVPRFHVHCLLAGCVEEDRLIHLVDDDIRHTPQWPTIRDKTADEIVHEVEAMGITVDQMKEFWFHDSKTVGQFWSKRFLKHHRFSISDCIPDYVDLIRKFANKYLLDNSLGNYLAKNGFETGKYYDSDNYLKAVDEYFGVKACVRYKKHGTHPSANDILVLLNKDGNELRDHPFHDKVANGNFLLRNI